MTIKNFFRTARALTPWLSLAAPFALFGILMAIRVVSPDLFCMPVNPGAKETVCGQDYSHPDINLLRFLGLWVWLLLLIVAGAAEVFRGRATRAAVIAWSVSALLFSSWVILYLSFPVECSP